MPKIEGVAEIAVPIRALREARTAAKGAIAKYKRKMFHVPTDHYKYKSCEKKIERLELFLTILETQVGDLKYDGQ